MVDNFNLDDERDLTIYAEQVRLVYKPFSTSVAATFAGIFLFAVAQWRVVDHVEILGWVFVISVIMLMRGLLAYLYFKKKPAVSESKLWGRLFILGAAVTGLVWGTGAVLLFPEDHVEHQIFVVIVIIGMCSGAVTGLSVMRSALYAYMLPAMLPLIPLFIMEDSYLSNIVFLVVLIALIFYSKNANNTYFTLLENIQLRLAAVEKEHSLLLAKEEAENANRAKSDFLSSMSHELRTPLNAILGFGQLVKLDETLSNEQQDNMKEITRAGKHLLELINDVLDLAKIESGHIDLSLEPVEIDLIINDCLNLVSTLAHKRDIQLNQSGLKKQVVRADSTRLRQIFINLLSNAIKYNHDGGSVTLEVMPSVETDQLRINVTDTGPGIADDRLEELFQPFNRLGAENSEIEGTGIGLTLTRRIVEMMGGEVNVISKAGVGSTFWIELPLDNFVITEPDNEHSQEQQRIDSAIPASQSNTTQHTVLYIEDNPINLKLVVQILGRRPHLHLITAHTPELGIELARSRLPELILLDINLPGMDGYQVLDIFKNDNHTKAIPVIALTANAMSRDFERGKAAGFNDYLTKPIDIVKFNEVLDYHLDGIGS